MDPKVDDFGWLLEDYRVSLFAQELRGNAKASPAILKAAWRSIVD